ncbi:DUF2768 domain-containing protein [Fictibacillus sp. WQ 8-8]|uniref:DUF2768 domain-containing protein n=1 Tax=unclassified Fictibacillus TaxID=2644029 RepID=UPI0006A77F30|nr:MULTISPECIES: DUF2768 domain-containing protein [unclassified Fictibacillus]MCQ6266039.1 DUF2768 domain-containing protein [Fictibacillus sp. WQ 8-8]MED2972741.1 DUF2768 domain-containing protein [Fictibacillus sp. B-59209]UZJ80821.1 DUF2768 domain-containing protein [Fictibacillus sp. KU28468]SFD73297.1 Protein of unknown function [Bacillus sp. OV194]
MDAGLMKMWVALSSIALMFIAVFSIMISRSKLKGIFKYILAAIAYICMITAGILIVLVVFSGPVKG